MNCTYTGIHPLISLITDKFYYQQVLYPSPSPIPPPFVTIVFDFFLLIYRIVLCFANFWFRHGFGLFLCQAMGLICIVNFTRKKIHRKKDSFPPGLFRGQIYIGKKKEKNEIGYFKALSRRDCGRVHLPCEKFLEVSEEYRRQSVIPSTFFCGAGFPYDRIGKRRRSSLQNSDNNDTGILYRLTILVLNLIMMFLSVFQLFQSSTYFPNRLVMMATVLEIKKSTGGCPGIFQI